MPRRIVRRRRTKRPSPAVEDGKRLIRDLRKSSARIPPEIMAWARRRGERASIVNIFTPAVPPPGVVPKDMVKSVMAMDDATMSAISWAGVALTSAFKEGITFLGYPFLAELAQRAEYRQIVETVATDMTRKWIKLQSTGSDDEEESAVEAEDVDPDDDASVQALGKKNRVKDAQTKKVADIEKEMTRLDVRGAFKRLAEQDGFYGRAHLYIDTGDGDNRPELALSIADSDGEPSKVKVNPKRPVLALRPIEPVWTYPTRYNASDPLRADWFKPSDWFVMGKQLHASRLLTLVGREVADLLKPAYSFGGLSMTQMAKPYVDNWLRTRQSVADLIHAFSVMVLKTDLASINQGGDVAVLEERVEFFNATRDNKGLMLLNKDSEDFANVSAPISGLDLLQAQAQEHMAAVSRIPIVKLLGIQPAGLNASSEGEITVYAEGIHAYQESLFRAPLTLVLKYIQLSLWGEVDEDITFDFEPLEELTELEAANLRKVEAETDAILVNDVNAISPEEVRARVAADPDTPYADIDPADVPEPPQPEPEAKPFGGAHPMDQPAFGDRPDVMANMPREAANDGVVPFVVDEDCAAALDAAGFTESQHPRDDGGKFSSVEGLSQHPMERMREYTSKELDWEYEREYKQYSRSFAPNAFKDRADFQKKYDTAPLRHLSHAEFHALQNTSGLSSMVTHPAGKPAKEKYLRGVIGKRRDVDRIYRDLDHPEHATAPPIILKKGSALRLMSGNTRLLAGASRGLNVPVKVIDVGSKQVGDEAAFKEADHPRDAEGKFASSYSASSQPIGELKGAGFKKSGTSSAGKPVYQHTAGHKVVFEPPMVGGKYSSQWTHYHPTSTPEAPVKTTGYGASALKSHLAKHVPAASEPQPVTPPVQANVNQAQAEVGVFIMLGGYSPVKVTAPGGAASTNYYQKGSKALAVDPDGSWVLETPGHMTKMGKGVEALSALLTKPPGEWQKAGVTNAPAGTTAAPPPAPPTPAEKAAQAAKKNELEKAQAHQAALQAEKKQAQQKAQQLMQKLIAAAPQPTSAEASAVGSYTGSSYQGMNDKLRHGGAHTPGTNKLKEWLDRAALPEDATLWRGLSGDYGKFIRSIAVEGMEFTDRGFSSCSVREDFSASWGTFSGGMLVRIDAKKGQKGAAVKHLSSHSGEDEVVLQAATRFRVTQLDYANHRMIVEIVG